MSNTNNNSGIWMIVLIVFGVAMFLNAIGSNSSNTVSAPATVDRNSFEHRYATERLKQEGYSPAESQRAADVIYKFNNAQKARQEGLNNR
jgi:hypothetical protein